jgi:hypothetical protein
MGYSGKFNPKIISVSPPVGDPWFGLTATIVIPS